MEADLVTLSMTFSMNPFGKKVAIKTDRESLSFQMEKAIVGGTKRLLFLDDDTTLIAYLKHEVESEYRVEFICCHKSSEAEKQIMEDHFHAAVLDVNVANGNGVALYKKIASVFPGLRVIFLTGYDSTGLRKDIEAIGPAMVLSKDSLYKPGFIEQLMAQLGIRKRGLTPT